MAKWGVKNPRVTASAKVALPSARRPQKSVEEKRAKKLLEQVRSESNHQTPEADQHAKYERVASASGKARAYNTTGTALDYYAKKRLITSDQCDAGKRLYNDWYNSRRVMSGFKSCLDITIGGSNGLNKAGLNMQAYEAYSGALGKIHTRYRKITVSVCCEDMWLNDIKSAVPKYRRMDALLRGLDELARYYEEKLNPRKVMRSFHAHVTTTQGDPTGE